MKIVKKIMFVPFILIVLFLVGCTGNKKSEVRTFSDWTDNELFQKIPALIADETRIGSAEDYGYGTFIIEVQGTSLEDYKSYLTLLESEEYKKYYDNGENGIDGCVYTTTYTKEKITLTVSHMVKTNITYIAASDKMNLSEHLFYKEEYVADNQPNAKTSLHLLELHTYGDSYVIKMKNGHLLMIDGGMEMDTSYLLEYLETLVPEGEKPIIEGWFVTHGHSDHIGPFTSFVKSPEDAKRLIVNGIYFSEPNKVVGGGSTLIQNVEYASMSMKTEDGEKTPIYRPQTGQTYYFNDITIEVLHTQEQLAKEDYENDNFNDSSSWFLFTIDGQKFLDAGDASEGGISVIKRTYNQEYFDLDMISVFHHGQNVYDSYVNYFDYDVAIYPTFVVGSQTANWQTKENETVQKNAKECVSWGDGTKIFTFPYKLGTYESLPLREWLYHPGRKAPTPY